MTLLVFGRTGQVAAALRHQADVVALGRDAADLAQPADCAAAILHLKPAAVINAAAYTAVDRAETEESLAQRVNADSPGAMARACASLGIPFAHVSTDYVFPGTGTRPWREDDPTDPQNAYGRSKLAGEVAVRAAGVQHIILRTAWVFSAHGTNFVKTMLRLSETRDSLRVVEDQIGCPTPAAAIAATLLTLTRAMRADAAVGGTYHYGGAPETSWADFARTILALAGRPVTVTGIPSSDYPLPAARPLNARLDCSALRTAFGVVQPDWATALPQIIKETSRD